MQLTHAQQDIQSLRAQLQAVQQAQQPSSTAAFAPPLKDRWLVRVPRCSALPTASGPSSVAAVPVSPVTPPSHSRSAGGFQGFTQVRRSAIPDPRLSSSGEPSLVPVPPLVSSVQSRGVWSPGIFDRSRHAAATSWGEQRISSGSSDACQSAHYQPNEERYKSW